jgi:hypothetical protein
MNVVADNAGLLVVIIGLLPLTLLVGTLATLRGLEGAQRVAVYRAFVRALRRR